MIGKTGFQYNNPIKDISESMPIPHQTLDHLRTTQNDPADPIDPILTRNTPANLAESDGSLDLSFGQKLYSNSILGLHGSLSNSRNASPLNKMTMENHTADFNISLNSTKRTSSVDTQSSIWATMETLTITSPLDRYAFM
ncbi:hypothetical protein BC833DRAFT_32504 [Globomyces pollinis-pini]|nr:hypothetical protein BC833DRAFT_32504 [Globomyces pollinis-pini]